MSTSRLGLIAFLLDGASRLAYPVDRESRMIASTHPLSPPEIVVHAMPDGRAHLGAAGRLGLVPAR